jgi:hypothetical protein
LSLVHAVEEVPDLGILPDEWPLDFRQTNRAQLDGAHQESEREVHLGEDRLAHAVATSSAFGSSGALWVKLLAPVPLPRQPATPSKGRRAAHQAVLTPAQDGDASLQ